MHMGRVKKIRARAKIKSNGILHASSPELTDTPGFNFTLTDLVFRVLFFVHKSALLLDLAVAGLEELGGDLTAVHFLVQLI